MTLCKGFTNRISKGIQTEWPCESEAWKDGYCKTHHPDSKKKAEQKRQETLEKKWAAERLMRAESVARPDHAEARKAAGLLTLDEARALGAKV